MRGCAKYFHRIQKNPKLAAVPIDDPVKFTISHGVGLPSTRHMLCGIRQYGEVQILSVEFFFNPDIAFRIPRVRGKAGAKNQRRQT